MQMDGKLKLETDERNENSATKNAQCQRPRRNVMQRSAEYNHGLLWTEEKELEKALYASLYKSKKGPLSDNDDINDSVDMEGARKRKCSAFRKGMLSDDNSNMCPKRAKVHAQRKFAQGSNPSSPSVTPVKLRPSTVPTADLTPVKKPKTEDFLTFLCLRGTPLLPASLDYLNVASRQNQGSDAHSRASVVNGEIIDKPKVAAKQPNLPGLKLATKPPVKPSPEKPVRAHVGLKKLYSKDDLSSSSESSLSDTDDEICNSPEKNKPVIYDMTKKKTIDVSGVIGNSSWLDHGGCPGKGGADARRANPVLVLKQKYRQQRFAKKKEAVKRAKKMDLAALNSMVDEKPDVGALLPPQLAEGRARSAMPPRASKYAVAADAEAVVPARRGVEARKELPRRSSASASLRSCGALTSKGGGLAHVAASEPDSSKPITRHAAAMLLKTARERERNVVEARPAKAAVKPKPARPQECIDLPLLESEHSYVKRLPVLLKVEEVPVVRSRKAVVRNRKSSDFSSDDDVPLAKRSGATTSVRGVAAAAAAAKKAEKSASKAKPVKRMSKMPWDFVSCEVDEDAVRTTPSRRPTRKTKEAATLYLELLGRKLNAPDDDFDMLDQPQDVPSTSTTTFLSRKVSGSKSPRALPQPPPPPTHADNARSKSSLPVKSGDKQPAKDKYSGATSGRTGRHASPACDTRAGGLPWKSKKGGKKVEVRSSIDITLDHVVSGHREPVKTREFMKKLSEAQFRLAKTHVDDDDCSSNSSPDPSPPEKRSKQPSSDRRKAAKVYNARGAAPCSCSRKVTAVSGGSARHDAHRSLSLRDRLCDAGRPAVGAVTRGNEKKTKGGHRGKMERSSLPVGAAAATAKSLPSKKTKHFKKGVEYGFKGKHPVKLYGGAVCVPSDNKVMRPHVPKVLKSSYRRRSSTSDDSDDSYCVKKAAPVRRFGRPLESSRMRPCDVTSSDSSSESSEDNPSKPESTTISVRQNVPSNSVAVQVNLMNDISELDDDFWKPGFLDADIENLFALDRVVTPTLSKGASPTRSVHRGSWEGGEGGLVGCSSSSRGNRSGESTPTKKAAAPTPDRVEAAGGGAASSDRPKQKSPLKTPLPKATVPYGGPPAASKKPTSVDAKPMKLEDFYDSDDDDDEEDEEDDDADNGADDDDDTSSIDSVVGNIAEVVDAPVYFPNVEEFQDPLLFIEKIRSEAEKFGVCKIVPPLSFKPECKISEDMRFTAHNQYVHKMLHRWGPNVQQLHCVRKHLEAQEIKFDHPPLIGGMELDLPRLFQTVQEYGGLKEVIEKKKWQKVADSMKIVKSAQYRVTKLYDAYCKYLLPYDTLSREEKLKLEQQVCSDRQRGRGRCSENDECVTKGRSMSLSSFCRIARNTMAMWFKHDPKPTEVEYEYWRCVTERLQHICVNAGNIDSSTYGYGFSSNRSSPYSRHPWNLKVLTNNSASILRCLGPVMGVTIPTLHVGMLFTTGCWYRDPHCLPWIEYLHSGASKIWYGVPASQSNKFREAMNNIVPEYCTENPIWLPSDMAMVPPSLLIQHGASLCRLVQNSGEYVVVFPRAFTSTICCGYSISESVYFAGPRWLELAPVAFKEISDSCEPAVFSLQRLLIGIVNDPKVSVDILREILPLVTDIRSTELELRKQLYFLGLKHSKRIEAKDAKKKLSRMPDDEEKECDICRANCYVSLVYRSQDDVTYCLRHAVEHLQKKKRDFKFCELLYRYDYAELNDFVRKVSELIQSGSAKKQLGKKKSR